MMNSKRKALLLIFALWVFAGCETKETIHIYMIGDSTMANKKESARPETGWGQVFNSFFKENIVVSNHAKNGRSSKSFRDEGLWEPVLRDLKKGDYVIIQFGHNDAKPDTARHADPYTTYTENLRRYVEETQAKGAQPVLCTSIVRRKFDGDQLTPTHGDYPDAVRKLAQELNIPLLDLQRETFELVSAMGPEDSKKLYLYTQPGEFPNRPDGVKDDTHLNPEGAEKVAELAVECIKEQNVPLRKYLK